VLIQNAKCKSQNSIRQLALHQHCTGLADRICMILNQVQDDTNRNRHSDESQNLSDPESSSEDDYSLDEV